MLYQYRNSIKLCKYLPYWTCHSSYVFIFTAHKLLERIFFCWYVSSHSHIFTVILRQMLLLLFVVKMCFMHIKRRKIPYDNYWIVWMIIHWISLVARTNQHRPIMRESANIFLLEHTKLLVHSSHLRSPAQ